MSEESSTNVDKSENFKPNGKFAKGNKIGKGNPYMSRVAHIRSIIYDQVKDEDIIELIQKLITMGKGGNLKAIEEILNRVIGKSKEHIEITGQDGENFSVRLILKGKKDEKTKEQDSETKE